MKRLLALCLLLSSCSATCGTVKPVPTPPEPIDYVALCAHLADIGCPEGAASNCASTFAKIQDQRISDLQPKCLLDAEQKSEARNCGTIACQ